MGATAIVTGLIAAASVATTVKATHDQKKEARAAAAIANNTPKFNADAEEKKAANQEAEANRKRVMGETDTIKTTALGDTGATLTKKKTLLGG